MTTVTLLAAVALAGSAALAAAPSAATAAHPAARAPHGAATAFARYASRGHVTAAGRPGRHYAVARPACRAARPGHAACDAVVLTPAEESARGAHAYTVSGSPGIQRGPSGGLTPGDLATAYDYNPLTDRSTNTIGIVDADADPTITSDYTTFVDNYGLARSAGAFSVVNQDGRSSPLPTHVSKGFASETALDVEAARAVCVTCRIVLVEAKDSRFRDLAAAERTAIHLGAKEVSNSYGGVETHQSASSLRHLAQAYSHKGVVITSSTGDDGWHDWDQANVGVPAAKSPEIPAAFDTVVAVGGTTLTLRSDGRYGHETVWNSNGAGDRDAEFGASGASGGGCSATVTATRWQRDTRNFGLTGCGTHRLAADISADGDPFTGFDVYNTTKGSGWVTVGGTSLASPVIAGMWALAGGAHGLRNASLSLYGAARTTPSSVHDVRSGGNGFCGGESPTTCRSHNPFQAHNPNAIDLRGRALGLTDCGFSASGRIRSHRFACYATTGYDGPSGVGTPHGLTLFRTDHPRARISPTATAPQSGHAIAISGRHSRDPFPGGRVDHWYWSFGDHSHSHSSRPTHSWAHPGTYTVTLVVRDSYRRADTTTMTVTVS